ncbi:unnamed protein product [Withania somnifera]
MSASMEEDESASKIHLPADIDWEMLDKSKFFSWVLLSFRQQVMSTRIPCLKMAGSMLRNEGYRGFYRGFGTSLTGTIPARALYMGALELTKNSVGSATVQLGFSEATSSAIANAAAGLSAAMAAQLVWTPVDVVSQRLMVQGSGNSNCGVVGLKNYSGGIDAFRKIVCSDGLRGLYRGFGISILTYAPSNAVWWGSYSIAHRVIWGSIGCYCCKKDGEGGYRPDGKAMVAVQAVSAAMASGVSAVVTMPLDTVKTRLQVLDDDCCSSSNSNSRRTPTVFQTVKNLVKEGGFSACYRGLGPRWASMSTSAITMITTYEFLKKLSTKNQETFV